ncbi:TPA: hypothetical protein QEL43_004000 [Stenotrophomonas maltophilia]|nr:hypothetical protein [Stenotrophomonas maltophilia]MBH1843197.1 hypothetical protein [Stenotrophomonas maltophilia]HDS1634317.1 hypothetical protein [Stenotrophomonas maltophilia]
MPQSHPPVPAKLREMLKDYPDHIEQLQQALNSVKDRRIKSVPPFEAAVWTLEDKLDGFIREARIELADAEASNDPQAVARAKEKEQLMLTSSFKRQWLGDESIHTFYSATEK